jgi:hypothetical protein
MMVVTSSFFFMLKRFRVIAKQFGPKKKLRRNDSLSRAQSDQNYGQPILVF